MLRVGSGADDFNRALKTRSLAAGDERGGAETCGVGAAHEDADALHRLVHGTTRCVAVGGAQQGIARPAQQTRGWRQAAGVLQAVVWRGVGVDEAGHRQVAVSQIIDRRHRAAQAGCDAPVPRRVQRVVVHQHQRHVHESAARQQGQGVGGIGRIKVFGAGLGCGRQHRQRKAFAFDQAGHIHAERAADEEAVRTQCAQRLRQRQAAAQVPAAHGHRRIGAQDHVHGNASAVSSICARNSNSARSQSAGVSMSTARVAGSTSVRACWCTGKPASQVCAWAQ